MWFLALLFTYSTAYASAPALDQITLPPLNVTWDKEMTPVFVGIKGEQGKKIKKQNSASLTRMKFVGQKLTLLFIPKQKDLAPIEVKIPDTLNGFHVAKELAVPIKSNELWLWGNTDKSKCGGDSSFSMRFINKKSLYKNLSGLFIWKIKKDQLPMNTAFYILPSLSIDMPSTISSNSFSAADKLDTTKCEVHTGGECPYVFTLQTSEKGMKSRIRFYGNTNSVADYNCPI